MSKRNKVMSDELKMEIAKELGIYDVVSQNGFGAVSSKACGDMVSRALQKASDAQSAAISNQTTRNVQS